MSQVTVLRSTFDRSAWKIAFADFLIVLCPEMNPDAADEAADREVITCGGLDPAVAATQWVVAQGTGVAPAAVLPQAERAG